MKNKIITSIICLVALLITTLPIHGDATSLEGQWSTFDDSSNLHKSTVKIYKNSNGKYDGKILEIFNPDEKAKRNTEGAIICDLCKGSNHNQPIKGMVIINNMEYSTKTKTLKGGTILDPENGKVYKAKIWLSDKKDKNSNYYLNVRGYILFLFRTQTWTRLVEKK